MTLYVVTVATHSQFYFPYLIESCKKNGYELVVLGYDEKWKGFTWRFKLVIEFLKSLKKNDIVCFIDGFDVIVTRNLKHLENDFLQLRKEHNCKIIIGEHKIIENNYFLKINKLIANIYFGKCKDLLLNAGTYIGEAQDLLDILLKIYNKFTIDDSDDQILLTKYCNLYPNDIYIDTNNQLFLTLELPYREIDKYLEFDKLGIKYNNNYPFFIHGPGQTYLDNLIIKMNYNYDHNNKVKNQIFNDIFKRIIFYCKKNKKYFIILIFIIIFILIFSYRKVLFSKKTLKNLHFY